MGTAKKKSVQVGKAKEKETPAQLGFRMPAEWEPHRATWIAWPHHAPDWPGRFAPIPWVYAEVVRNLTRGDGPSPLPREVAAILVDDEASEKRVRAILKRVGVDMDWVEFHRHPTDRVWTRDYAPIFVKNGETGEVAVTNWKFNGWAKYPNHELDDAIPALLARALKKKQFRPMVEVAGKSSGKTKGKAVKRQMVLEGGSIDVNGLGTILTTEECLLSDVQARNPGVTFEALEDALAENLALSRAIWLGRGIAGDDTHGHVDDLARFAGPRTVVLCSEENAEDANYRALAENYERLQGERDQDGNSIEVVKLPMPSPVVFDGVRLPASYANFYIANRTVLVPTFNDANDRVALGILQELFVDRLVVGIHAVDLVWGLGTLHCMTQQEPVGWDMEKQMKKVEVYR